MESQQRIDHLESEDGNQITDQTHSFDKQAVSPTLKVAAQIKEGEDFPDLWGHSSVFMKNKIVLFGGQDSNDDRNNVLNIYDLGKSAWSSKTLKGESDHIPKSRYLHTANAVGDSIFVIGGRLKDNSGDSNVYRIHFGTQKCQIVGNVTEPVLGHTADVHKQSIYVFGGISQKTHTPTSLLQKYNLETNEYEVIELAGDQPEGRKGHKSVIVSDNLYVFGGQAPGKGYFQDLFSVDISTKVSTKIDQRGLIPSPRQFFSFFAFEDQLYLF